MVCARVQSVQLMVSRDKRERTHRDRSSRPSHKPFVPPGRHLLAIEAPCDVFLVSKFHQVELLLHKIEGERDYEHQNILTRVSLNE